VKIKEEKSKKRSREQGSHEEDGDVEKKPKKETAFSKPLKLSSRLADFFGCATMGRTDIVKELWNYIRTHNLQNPADKREILLDPKMKSVFKTNSFTMFTMNKYIKEHVTTII
jgi:upstream activation factor subunit UAF30